MLTRQLVDLAAKLPDYKENIHTKLRSIKLPSGGVFKKFSDTVEELKKDLPGAETPPQAAMPSAAKPKTSGGVASKSVPVAPSVQLAETSS